MLPPSPLATAGPSPPKMRPIGDSIEIGECGGRVGTLGVEDTWAEFLTKPRRCRRFGKKGSLYFANSAGPSSQFLTNSIQGPAISFRFARRLFRPQHPA